MSDSADLGAAGRLVTTNSRADVLTSNRKRRAHRAPGQIDPTPRWSMF